MGENGTCEICHVNDATDVKGGINFLTGQRGLWYCCRECIKKIEDERTKIKEERDRRNQK
jgi:hypothetical protein